MVNGRENAWRSRAPGPHAHRNTARQVVDGLWTEARGQRKQSNEPGNDQHNPQYANYWAPLTRKRHIPPQPPQPRHTNHCAPRARKRHQQEHRPQRPTKRSDPTQHAKGRTGDRPGPRKETTPRRNVTRGGATSPPSNASLRPPPTPTPRRPRCRVPQVPDVPDEPALRGKVDRLHKAFRQTFAGLHFADDQDHGADAKRRAYSALLQRLVAKAGEPDLKWQTKLIIAHSVRLLLAWAPRGTPEYRLPPCVLEYCLQTPLSDQPYIRQVATKALMVLMRLLKPLHPRRPVPAPELSPSGAPFLSRDDLLQMAARAPASEEAFDAAAFVDKSAFGFCAMPTVAVLDRDAGGLRNGAGDGISRQLEGFRGLLLQTLTPEYMGQFMHLFCLDYSGHSDSDQYLAQVCRG